MNDSLGDRIKGNYEARARHYLTRRTPVVIRVDGRAFHTYTQGFKRPFDGRIIDAMVIAATQVYTEMQGCKMAYIQSDEVSFVLTDYDGLNTEAWFDYCQNKIESISAALMSVAFHKAMRLANHKELVVFDARAFNIPESEVANYFLWRAKDWLRNSVQMLAQSVFSHKELQGLNIRECLGLLRSRGHDWDELLEDEKYGTFIAGTGNLMQEHSIEATFKEINALWETVCPKDTLTPNLTTAPAINARQSSTKNASASRKRSSAKTPTASDAGSAPRKAATRRSLI